jgi:quinoprotein dehydrogenase-associated probable ABC transporter substrate-binding protein
MMIHRQPKIAAEAAPTKPRVAVTTGLALLFLVPALPAVATAASHAPPAGKTLRVCADPNNLPFSNRAGQGFENHLAKLVAKALGEKVHYTWSADRKHFLQTTLKAGRCDVVMGIPARSDRVLTTHPYFRSTYSLVYRKNAPYTLRSLNDPKLTKLSIGVRALGDDFNDLPAGSVLARRGIVKNVVTYNVFTKQGGLNSAAQPIEDVAKGKIDTAILWGPEAGYYAKRQPVDLVVQPLTPEHTVLPFEYSISLGVRKGDQALRAKLNQILQRKRGAIRALLTRYGVPLLGIDSVSAKGGQIGMR